MALYLPDSAILLISSIVKKKSKNNVDFGHSHTCYPEHFHAPGSGLELQNDKRRLSVFHGLLATDIHSAKEFMSLWDYLENWPNELLFCIEQTIRNKTQKMHHIQDFIKHIILQWCCYTQFTSSCIKKAQLLFFFLIRKREYEAKILSFSCRMNV